MSGEVFISWGSLHSRQRGRSTPTYHAAGFLGHGRRVETRGDRYVTVRYVTVCGLPISELGRDSALFGIRLPLRHAKKFGKPCRRCS